MTVLPLQDVVSYNEKHNQPNGEGNRDGSDRNFSNNHGVEGLVADDAIVQRRRASQRAMLATLLLSQGTPMLLAGDEQGHSQQGNNNAYCQDNATTWLDWPTADDALIDYVAALIALRRRIPALQQDRWWQQDDGSVQWLNAQGQVLDAQQWGARRSVHADPAVAALAAAGQRHAANGGDEVAGRRLAGCRPFTQEDSRAVLPAWHQDARSLCVLVRK